MSQGRVAISVKGVARVERGHPWIFRSDVVRERGAEPGSIVRVEDARGRPLGFALYSSRSEIRLRMIERSEALPADFLEARLARALAWRDRIASGVTTCRLVHGEADGLPSLIVDRYGEYLVVQTLSQGMDSLKGRVTQALVDKLHPKGILERNDPRVRQLEGLEAVVGLLHGTVPESLTVELNGLQFEADLWRGQKTGLFLDQRENQGAARGYARGRVLDVFAYHGGFALSVAASATEVIGVDVSGEALKALHRNAARNGITNVTTREENAFDVLHELDARGERFDTVILDPPAFAKSKDAVAKARRAYKEINLRALKMLQPGGCLITCSCSYHVHEAELEEILAAAVQDAACTATLVEKRRQARDHPILIGVPETSYLKCFIVQKLA
jgi:23S rRNA (cytosine1962-C5)-methyltransferase